MTTVAFLFTAFSILDTTPPLVRDAATPPLTCSGHVAMPSPLLRAVAKVNDYVDCIIYYALVRSRTLSYAIECLISSEIRLRIL